MNAIRSLVNEHIKDYFDLIIAISLDRNISIDEVILQEDILNITPAIMLDLCDDSILKLIQLYIRVGYKQVEGFDLYEIIKMVSMLNQQEFTNYTMQIEKLNGCHEKVHSSRFLHKTPSTDRFCLS